MTRLLGEFSKYFAILPVIFMGVKLGLSH